jgi:hypothetical protein
MIREHAIHEACQNEFLAKQATELNQTTRAL